ncbi:MAG TPA: glycerol-3-phosphate 1-O-acyltransferase PlsY [Candidatus Angelobacter sp.]|nr:glycerol-3-phosphate 1-O-acyltransferase PlsY [Candidatus Angelobacter sp.]
MTVICITVAVVAYLLGSIPFGYLLVKIFRGQDIRLTGSGNIGATNVARSGAKGLGIATLLLDAAKGLLAVWFASALAQSSFNTCGSTPCLPAKELMSLAALFAVLGHVFTVWLKFRGGKGVATALGTFVLLYPRAVLICLAVFVVIVAVSRYISLGSIVSAAAVPVVIYMLGSRDWLALLMISAISLLVIVKHQQNIGRILAGNENRFGSRKPPVTGMEKQI